MTGLQHSSRGIWSCPSRRTHMTPALKDARFAKGAKGWARLNECSRFALVQLAVKRVLNCNQNSCSLHNSKAPALKMHLQQQRERLVDSHLKCQSLARRGLCLRKDRRSWLQCLSPTLTVGLKTRSRSWSLTCLAAPWRFALG